MKIERKGRKQCPLHVLRSQTHLFKSDTSVTYNDLLIDSAILLIGLRRGTCSRSPSLLSVTTVTHYQCVLHSSLGSTGGDDTLSFLLQQNSEKLSASHAWR